MTNATNDIARLGQLITRFRDTRFPDGIRCPRCGARRASRWGSFRARQRYRCAGCGRTFSDLTGSPAAYAKKLELWPAFAALLASGESLRRTAAVLGIHPSTAFRWRHALLAAIDQRDQEPLDGWIEIASRRLAYSQKGTRSMGRPALRRGYRPSSQGETRRVHIVVACDRAGRCVTAAIGPTPFPPDSGAFGRLLSNRVESRLAIIAAQGPFCPAGRFTRRCGGIFHDARPHVVRRPRTLVHVDNALSYLARLWSWLRRFRGVATRYLANYLIWHRMVDEPTRRGIGAAALRWPVDDIAG